MNEVHFACRTCGAHVDAGYRWAYWELEHPGVVSRGAPVDLAAVERASAYWAGTGENRWLAELLPRVRAFLERHRGHELVYDEDEGLGLMEEPADGAPAWREEAAVPPAALAATTIRPLGPGDAEAFQALRLRGLLESPAAFGSTHAEEVGLAVSDLAARLGPDPDGVPHVVLGAFRGDGRLVGLLGCHRERKAKRRHAAGLWGMYVAPEARGRGIGGALLDAAIGTARGWPGVARLTLTVVPGTTARALYLARGFVPFGLEPRALRSEGGADDLEHMLLELADAPGPTGTGT